MSKKNLICIFMLICLLFWFSACRLSVGNELGERLIIEALAIDTNDGIVNVMIQALSLGEIDSDGTKTKHRTLSVSGDSIGEALNGITAQTGLVPLYSQTRILLFGERTAKAGLRVFLDFFLREAGIRGDMLVAVTHGNASDVFSEEHNEEPVTAEMIEKIMTQGLRNGNCVKSELYRFLSLYYSESDSAFCPILLKRRDKKGTVLSPAGTAVFSGDQWTETLPTEKTLYFLFLTQDLESGNVTLNSDETFATIRISDSKTETDVTKKASGGFCATVKIHLTADLTEISTNEQGPASEKEIRRLSDAIAKNISENTEDVFCHLFYESHHDVLRLYKRITLRYPITTDLYNYTLFDKYNTKVQFDVHVEIRWLGKERPG